MMSYSRFSSCIIGAAILGVAATLLVNYVVDPYSVFGTKVFSEYGQLQERYLKIEYLKTHREFNTFVLGGSRIGVVKTEDVNRSFSGAKSYNLTLSQAIPLDIEQHVEWLVNHAPKLAHVIVQIDWPSEYAGHLPRYALLDEAHPDISGRSRYDFLLSYLTHLNFEALKEKVDNSKGGLNQIAYDLAKGYWSRPLRDQKIDANCEAYVANESSFGQTNIHPVKLKPEVLSGSLATIGRIKSSLDKKNVKLTVLLSPWNRRQIDAIDLADYEKFVAGLASITGFFNFMYYNQLTRDDCNYYELAHYRPRVGELIARALAIPSSRQGEISHYVSRETVSSHLEFIKANFASGRP